MLDNLEKTMKALTGKDEPLKKSLCLGDTGYFSEENLQVAKERKVEVIIPDPQFRQRDPDFEGRENKKGKTRYKMEDFKYDQKNDTYICPYGKRLVNKGKVKLRNNEGQKYQASAGDCMQCPMIGQCVKMRNKDSGKRKSTKRTLYVIIQKYEENLSAKMRKKIDDPVYRELYTRRQQIIEPVFSDITYCKGMDRFTLRGTEKVDIQWKLYCIVHNIGKCREPLMKKYGREW